MLSSCAWGNIALIACCASFVLVAYDMTGSRNGGPHRSAMYAVSLLGSLAFTPPSIGYALHAVCMTLVALACVGVVSHPASRTSTSEYKVKYAHLLFAPAVGLASIVHIVHCVVGVTVWAWASALVHATTRSWLDIACASSARSVLYAGGGSALREMCTVGDGLWAFVRSDARDRIPPHPKWGPTTNTAMFSMVRQLASGALTKPSSTKSPVRKEHTPRLVVKPHVKKPMGQVVDAPSSDEDE